jgi:hypothetical protein
MGPGYPDSAAFAGLQPKADPNVRVFSGASGALVRSFIPFEQGYWGGVHLAVGHIDADSKAEMIVSKANGDLRTDAAFNRVFVDPFRRSEVSIFQDAGPGPLERISNFVAYPHFGGSVRMAAVDQVFRTLDADETYAGPALITGAGPGGGAHVRQLTDELALLDEFFAYRPDFLGGLFLAGSVR